MQICILVETCADLFALGPVLAVPRRSSPFLAIPFLAVPRRSSPFLAVPRRSPLPGRKPKSHLTFPETQKHTKVQHS